MADRVIQRRLAAIFAADMAGHPAGQWRGNILQSIFLILLLTLNYVISIHY